MTFRKKAAVLSILVLLLALVYILTFVFDPQRKSRDVFSWLDPGLMDMVDRIEISGSGSSVVDGGRIVLSRKNNIWVCPAEKTDYPVKQGRVEDLLAVLSGKETYPLRASSMEAREKLGLPGGNASRIIIRGGAGLPLLDLLVGSGDVLSRSVYLKRADKNEIFSGEDRFTVYTESDPVSWYDLRLFPPETGPGIRESGIPGQNSRAPGAQISVGAIQQAEVLLPMKAGQEKPLIYTLRRSGGGWILIGNESAELDTVRIEAWLRSILEAEGENFGDGEPASPEFLASVEGSITLWLGDGTTRTVQTGPEKERNSRIASVSSSPFQYVLPASTVSRLFRESSYFLAGL